MNIDSFLFFATGVCVGISASMLFLEDTKKETAVFALERRVDHMEDNIDKLFSRIRLHPRDQKTLDRLFAELEKGAEKE